jgi:LysR family transcriptional regulator for bpeEF and oprC
MDRFAQLQVFVRVAERASFTRAADDLDLSRAMVSQQVRSLERRLGARLLSRTTRSVGLTAEGAEYLPRARRILAELSSAEDSVSVSRGRPRGRLRVSVPVAFGRYVLARALPAFQQRYPDLAIDVTLEDSVADFVADRVDVAVRVGRVREPGLVARRIVTMRMVTCASPRYLADAGEPRSIEDLRRHHCIGRISPQTRRIIDWSFRRGTARIRWRPACALSFSLAEAVVTAGIAHGGVLQTADLMLVDAVSRGLLRPVLGDSQVDGPTMWAVYNAADRQSARVRVFCDFVERLMLDWSQRSASQD